MPLDGRNFLVTVAIFACFFAFFGLFCGFNMDLSQKNKKEEIAKLRSKIIVLSEYAASLESHVNLRDLKKISVIASDPFNSPWEQFGF